MRTVLLAVLVSCSAPQKSSPPATPPAPPVTQQAAAEPWVPVGSMMNPSFNQDSAATDVAAAFAAARIEHVSYGSLGFTIAVKASDAQRARTILRKIAHVSVVD